MVNCEIMTRKIKYEVTEAFHPQMFERGLYAVSFKQKGKLALDKYTKFTQVKARSRKEAIKKARRELNIF